MSSPMRHVAASVVATAALAAAAGERSEIVALADAERAFARMSVEQGQRAAFLAHFAPGGLVFGPGPQKLHEAYASPPPPPPPGRVPLVLDWYPVLSDLAASGELGYNTGPWLRSDPSGARPPGHGYFFSVWKKQPDGRLLVELDLGIEADGPDTVDTKESWRPARVAAWKAEGIDPAEAAAGLRRAEAALQQAIAKGGLAEAYAAALAADVRFYRNGRRAFRGRDAVLAELREAAALGRRSWEIAHAEAARSADLGYTWGALRVTPGGDVGKQQKGYYAHVWRRGERGEWTLAIEVWQATQG
jgi:ketosteroid isomerase-like protein